jgi:membrane protease YdiL (CAAX protease family)
MKEQNMSTGALSKGGGAVHGGILLAAAAVVAVSLPRLPWPWFMLLPLLLYAGIALALPPLRRTAPSLPPGRMVGAPLACAAALSTVTAGVLVAFQVLARPEVTAFAGRLPSAALGNLVLAGVGFSLVNATMEELIFRGVLWEAVTQEWNAAVAVGATALMFGLVHLHGYPPGPLGATLAGLYGMALGLLRWWAGGLGLPVACHVSADATLSGLVASSGAFG